MGCFFCRAVSFLVRVESTRTRGIQPYKSNSRMGSQPNCSLRTIASGLAFVFQHRDVWLFALKAIKVGGSRVLAVPSSLAICHYAPWLQSQHLVSLLPVCLSHCQSQPPFPEQSLSYMESRMGEAEKNYANTQARLRAAEHLLESTKRENEVARVNLERLRTFDLGFKVLTPSGPAWVQAHQVSRVTSRFQGPHPQ